MEYSSFLSALISTLCIIFFCFIFRSFVELNKFKNIPGPGPRLPIIGSLLTFFRPGISVSKLISVVLNELGEKYKKDGLAILCLGSKGCVFLLKAEYAAKIFKDNNHTEKPSEYNILKPLLGDSLLTANVQIWKNKRKLLNNTFHSKILENYITAVNDECIKFVEKLFELSKEAFVDIRPLMNELMFNIIAKTAMGVTLDENSTELKKYSKCLDRILTTSATRIYNPVNWYDFIFYKRDIGKQMKEDIIFVNEVTQNVINERRNNYKPELDYSVTKQKDFLDLLLTLQLENDSITDEDIRDDVHSFLFAGHETSGQCLTWTLFLLGNHDDCQRKLIEEMSLIFGDDRERDVSKDDLLKMHYTECVIKESLRLYPPIPSFGRVANTDVEIGGYCIPKGTSVFALTLNVHKDETIFSNPFDFIPERFENQTKIEKGFMPFALGPRNCIGQQFAMMHVKIILAHIFRKFEIQSIDKERDIELGVDVRTYSINPIRISFQAIK